MSRSAGALLRLRRRMPAQVGKVTAPWFRARAMPR